MNINSCVALFNNTLCNLDFQNRKGYSNNAFFQHKNTCKINFQGIPQKTPTIGYTNIKKIASEAEYDKILKNLQSNTYWSHSWNKENKFETGIMPYAGLNDLSSEINSFLRNGNTRMNHYMLEDIIRVLDFALNEIDKTYGKYEGFVYRYGFVDNNTRNYVSTARNPLGAMLQIENRHRCENPLYIIWTENGHKIEEVQKKLKYNSTYIEESEILLNPTTYFQEINYLTPEFEEAKKCLLAAANKERLNPIPKIKILKELNN